MTDTDGITSEVRDGVTVIRLAARYESIEETDIESLQKRVVGIAEAADPPRVVVDLSHTSFFGSSFIEVLFRGWRSLKKREGQFAIGGLSSYCREVLEVSKLDRIWSLHETADGAVADLSG